MPRDSRSPPRYRSERDGDSRQSNSGYGRERRRYDEDRDPPRRDNRGSRNDLYGYGERERERERTRDRERYDSGRDRDREIDRRSGRDRAGPSSRRSASPRRSRNHSRSKSKSGSASPPPVDKAKPNFKPSGLLAAETNTVKAADGKTSAVLKYNEPPEARKPVLGWRLYVFKGKEQVGKASVSSGRLIRRMFTTMLRMCLTEMLHIHRQSAYLIGRDRLVADIPMDHPSCSKQHAAIQCTFLLHLIFVVR
jgi:smad nuclear-interacting protein 1